MTIISKRTGNITSLYPCCLIKMLHMSYFIDYNSTHIFSSFSSPLFSPRCTADSTQGWAYLQHNSSFITELNPPSPFFKYSNQPRSYSTLEHRIMHVMHTFSIQHYKPRLQKEILAIRKKVSFWVWNDNQDYVLLLHLPQNLCEWLRPGSNSHWLIHE